MSELTELDDLLARLLRRIEPRTRYAEVMAQVSSGESIRHDRSSTVVQPGAEIRGAVFRAWGPRGWCEVGGSQLDPDALEGYATTLLDRLGYGGGAADPPGVAATTRGEAATKSSRPIDEMTLSDRLDRAKSWYAWATEVPGVKNAFVSLDCRSESRLFCSTAGARTLQTVDRIRGSVVALAVEQGKVEYDYTGSGGTGGAEQLDGVTPERVAHVAREAVELLQAPEAPSGKQRVLLDPSAAGTFAHESFGHGAEADQMVRMRSYLAPLLGTEVGPPEVTIVDDGSYAGGWGSIYFDDEGHRSGRTVLVDRGHFASALQDREAAALLGRPATGNTRRADCLSRPFVRMTNTFVEPGKMTFEEMVREMGEGVVLESCTSGVEDPLGGQMQIKVKKGHRVRGGEIVGILPSMALSGKVLEFLRAIRGVGPAEDFRMSPGFCGKGHTDLLPAGTGGSYLLSEATVGPA